MERNLKLINKILIELDSGTEAIGEWKFRYNSTIQGIEAYNENDAIIEAQRANESFEEVAERLLEKMGY